MFEKHCLSNESKHYITAIAYLEVVAGLFHLFITMLYLFSNGRITHNVTKLKLFYQISVKWTGMFTSIHYPRRRIY